MHWLTTRTQPPLTSYQVGTPTAESIDNDRFNRDFAAQDKMMREQQHKRRLDIIVHYNRVEKYERDMKRWEFMDEEGQREALKL
jgi:hypothetical protein